MAEAIIDPARRYEDLLKAPQQIVVGDAVTGIADGRQGVVTKVSLGRVQVDNKKWYKPEELRVIAGLATSSKGGKKQIKSSEYIQVLNELGYKFELCVLDDRVWINGAPVSDVTQAVIRSQMRDRGYTHTNIMEDAYVANAAANSFHPIKRYLEGLRYDGHEHIAKLSMLFEDEDNIFGVFFRRWLIGSVAKVYRAEQNPMLVLDGAQNMGKSHFVRWLCSALPEYQIEGPINPDNKDDQIRLMNKWIWEVAELGATTRKADREALKHFLTVRQVTARAPYGKNDLIKPALASFIGTINNEAGFLNDHSGNRRFVAVHLSSIDWGYTKFNPDNVWAEAAAAYHAGEGWRLDAAELELSHTINTKYEVSDPLEDLINQLFEIDNTEAAWEIRTIDILEALHTQAWRLRNPRAEAMALSSILKKMGVKKVKVIDGLTKIESRGYAGMRSRQPRLS